MHEGHEIRDPSGRKFFTIIPNLIVDNQELSHAAFRLYIYYKRICGDNPSGICFQTRKTISDNCSMNEDTVTKSRRLLESQGLISVENEVGRNGAQKIVVTLVDIWNKNNKVYATKSISTERGMGVQAEGEIGVRKKNHRIRRKLSGFDLRCAKELEEVVSSHIKVNKKSNMAEWADSFRLMRERDEVPKGDVRKAILWYKDNIGVEYIPEAFSAKAFRQKYVNGQIPAAMKKSMGNGSASQSASGLPDDLRHELVGKLCNAGWDMEDDLEQEDLDRVLVGMGRPPGSVGAGQI